MPIIDASESLDESISTSPSAPSQVNKVPQDIREVLSPAQITRLEFLLTRPQAKHVLAYRFSAKFGRQHIYFAMMSGIEKRSPLRLEAEAQNRVAARVILQATMLSLIYSGVVMSIAVVLLGALYIIKSYLGIDLFPEASFLHNWFYD